MKCLIFVLQILKDNTNLYHGCNHVLSKHKHGFQTKRIAITIEISLMGVCSIVTSIKTT
jgi:hypothetical protein